MIDLTLDSMLVPAINGYTPIVGTKIMKTASNKGGLTTQQVVENIAMPFLKQRSIIVEESEESSIIEYNANIMINNEDAIFTLGRGVSPGIKVQIMCLTSAKIRYLGITKNASGEQNTLTDSINAFTILTYIWTGCCWFCSSAPGLETIHCQIPGTSEPSKIYGGQWEEFKIAGFFLRAEGGDVRPYVEPMKVSVNGTNVIVDISDIDSKESLSTIKIGDLLISGEEYREITAISNTTITVDKEFNNPYITTVLIGSPDTMQGHKHTDSGHSHYYVYTSSDYNPRQFTPDHAYYMPVMHDNNTGVGYANLGLPTKYDNNYGEPRISTETKPKNLTVKYWKRIA